MILRVTNKDIDVDLGKVLMSVDEFIDISNHPYIITSGFDALVIDLDPKIPSGILSAVIGRIKIIPRIITEIDTDIIRLLAEIYPDKAAELRFTYIRDKDNIWKVINQIKSDFMWETFY